MCRHLLTALTLAVVLGPLSGCLDLKFDFGDGFNFNFGDAFQFGPLFPGSPCGEAGADGKVRFAYHVPGPTVLFPSCAHLDKVDLVSGGTAAIYLFSQGPALGVAEVRSSQPEVANFAIAPGQPGGLQGTSGSLLATAGQPGTAYVVLLDQQGQVIDRAQVTVAPATGLAAETAAPVVLAGATFVEGVRLLDGRGIMQGTGTVRFTPSPDLHASAAAANMAPPGEDGVALGASGKTTGTVAVDSGTVHVVIPVVVVTPADVTAVAAHTLFDTLPRGLTGLLMVSARAGAAEVAGVRCTWTTTPAGLQIQDISQPYDVEATYQISGDPGSYQAVCTVPGGPTATLPILIK